MSRKGETHKKHRRQHAKVCQHCETDFLGTRTTQKFCKKECTDAHWDSLHREQRAESIRQRRADDPEYNKFLGRTQYWRDPEQARADARAYIKTETGRKISVRSAQKRRATQRNAPGNGFTIDQFYEVCAEYEDHCLRCLQKKDREKLSADHVIPLARGGAHDIENIQPLCRRCNSRKHAQTIDYRPTFFWRGPSLN